MSLSPSSTLVGALFRNSTDPSRPNGPALVGNINIVGADRPASVSAWERVSTDGKTKFFTFHIELSRDLKYFGTLHPVEMQTDEEPDFTGVLQLSRETSQPVLQVKAFDCGGFLSVLIGPSGQGHTSPA